ncbi:MAG: hypothetical protein JWR05_2292 [Mucilaginibacter sp.]|nr:hypothetical protein [Mucilaginibacter sp.]
MVDYQTEFAAVLNKEFSANVKVERNFLDIAEMPHYENVNSNILQFFFDQNAEHGLSDLFLTSFVQLISIKREISFLDWTVKREVTTINNKRIDIEIQSVDEDKVIIIENKIYHWLANDLDEYWTHYSKISDENKVGVVLSLYSMQIKDSRFINITHQQLCKQVLKNLGNYILRANHKYIIYLKDFIDNINSFYMSDAQKDKLEFYFENIDKINKLATIKVDATEHVLKQLTIAGDTLGLIIGSKQAKDRRYFIFPGFKDNNLYYAIFVKNLFSSKATFEIILEGQNTGAEVQQHVFNTIKDKYPDLTHVNEPRPYIHYLKKTYDFHPTSSANFSKIILEILEKDFEAARTEVTQLLLEKLYV